jgi:hypothetical protein
MIMGRSLTTQGEQPSHDHGHALQRGHSRDLRGGCDEPGNAGGVSAQGGR